MRYTMQLAEVATPVPAEAVDESGLGDIGAGFGELYERLYGKGSGFAEAGLQLITYRTRRSGVLPIRPQLGEIPSGSGDPEPSSTRRGSSSTSAAAGRTPTSTTTATWPPGTSSRARP